MELAMRTSPAVSRIRNEFDLDMQEARDYPFKVGD